MGSTITFQFRAAQSGQTPAAVSWINTNLNLSGGYTYTWDADKKVYQITLPLPLATLPSMPMP